MIKETYFMSYLHTVRGANSGRGEVFRNRPDEPWGLPSLLYNGDRVSAPGVKRLECDVDHPPASSIEIKKE
jgi:hypothetical protein